MHVKTLGVLFFFLMGIALFGQAQIDKERFEKIFEEETTDEKYLSRDNHSGKYQYTRMQEIPEWFTQVPQSTNNHIVAVGISDPGMDTIPALETAVERAILMASILKRSTTQLLCYYFSDEEAHKNNVVYEHYSRIIAKPFGTKPNFEIIKQYTNAYDETMVMIKLVADSNAISNEHLSFELYKNETQTNVFGEYESVYELFINNYSYYQLTELGQRADVISQQIDASVQVPIYSLVYSFGNEPLHLSHGLWKAYYKSLMIQIIGLAKQKPESISAISDRYQSNSYERLTRGISINHMSLRLKGFKSANQRLEVEIEELAAQ